MVDGLQAAAEMAELVASAKSQDADRCLARQDLYGAARARAVVEAMKGLAEALRNRAASIDTGDYVPIGADPGPGWRRRKRTQTGSNTTRIRLPRRRRSTKSIWVSIKNWFS